MFERDIKFISDFCINQIRELGTTFTYEKLATLELHPAILKYVSAELDFMIYADRRKLLQNSYFDYSGKEISLYFKKMAEEVKKTKRISLEDMKKLILQAVSFNANFVVRPKWSLTKLVYNDQKAIPVDELEMMLSYVYYYDYFKNVLSTYLAKRKAVQLNLTEFDLILNKIERELLKANSEQVINNSLNSIADFFNIGGVSKTRVSPIAVEMFLKEKNLTDHLLRLRRAIPETAKKAYEINDIKSVLYATTPVQPNSIQGFDEEKKTIDKVETPSEEPNSTEAKEETEPEQGIVKDSNSMVEEEILQNEIKSDDLNIPDVSLEQIDEELKKDLEEISRLEEQIENEESETNIEEDLNSGIEEPGSETDEEAPVAEEQSVQETPGEQIVDEISIPVEEPEPVSDNNKVIATFKETLEQELQAAELKEQSPEKTAEDLQTERDIISEMLKDHFGDDQSLADVEDQTEEAEKLEAELLGKQSEVVPDEDREPEESGTEVETNEIVEENEPGIKSEETNIVNEVEDDFQKIDYIKTPEEELMDMFEDLEIIERGKTDFNENIPDQNVEPEIQEEKEPVQEEELSELDQIEIDLQTIDEIAFPDDENEIVTIENPSPVEIKSQPVESENKFQPSEQFEQKINRPTETAPSPRSLRKKDLLSYLKDKEVKKIISNVFGSDEVDFVTSTEKIMECGSYREATDIIKGIFLSYKINPYSKEAITLTNAVSNYFRQA
jgi:hypothetical protein